MPTMQPTDQKMTAAQFERIAEEVRQRSGIQLPKGKEDLVQGRLSRRIRILGLAGFDEYLRYLARDESGAELGAMIDALTTNVTSFFREPAHFTYLTEQVVPEAAQRGRRLRIWSAGCSNGAEPYTIAMTLRDAISDVSRWDIRILATDLSTTVLDTARKAEYPADVLRNVSPAVLRKHFTGVMGAEGNSYKVRDELTKMVTIGQLNLLGPWPMQSQFDAIFCRNVMIYFDRPTRAQLVDRYTKQLRPGGHLLVGHSESLSGMAPGLLYVQPATYRRPDGNEASPGRTTTDKDIAG